MKTLILRSILQQHGFRPEDIELSATRIKLKIKDADQQALRQEGAAIPGKRDSYFHNYIYSEGLISNLDQIEVTVHPQGHPLAGRVNTIRIPSAIYKDVAETANTMHGTNHGIQKNAAHVLLTVDYSNGGGSTQAELLIDLLILSLQPRIASSDDIRENINFISDLGRIAPLVGLGVQKEAKNRLLRRGGSQSLLQLRDQLVNSAAQVTTRTIDLDRGMFNHYVEKLVREEGYLVELVRQHLALDEKNWILADQDLFTNYLRNTNPNAEKLKSALRNRREPLFISTTTGNHAFAVTVDFANNTLFLANPGEDASNCNVIMEQIKCITGCTRVVRVLNRQLIRESDIPFDDLCTVDSLALVQMMMDQPALSEGCLNNALLRTGVFVRHALDVRMHQAAITVPVLPEVIPPLEHEEHLEFADDELPVAPLQSSFFNMQVLGIFTAVLGTAAVAIAFTVLNALTLGSSGLVLAGVGAAALLSGVGLFAVGFINENADRLEPSEDLRLAL